MSNPSAPLPAALVEQILAKLDLPAVPAPTLQGLHVLYDAWCRRVPFDNVRKLIHLRRQDTAPLPGGSSTDFFEAWLRHGTGGTCWAGNGALHSLLASLGFASTRGLATMLVGPDAVPNHGTVVVSYEERRYIVDASILHGEPLELGRDEQARAPRPAWSAYLIDHDGRLMIHWRALHNPGGVDCRIERTDVPASLYLELYERSRSRGPFNHQLYGRRNRGDSVIGTAFGQYISFDADGTVHRRALPAAQRIAFLVEQLGISEEYAAMVPPDLPAPPG